MKTEHLAHLTNLTYGGLARAITPADVAEEFIKNGYARHVVGGLVATDTAQQLLISHGIKPPKWQ